MYGCGQLTRLEFSIVDVTARVGAAGSDTRRNCDEGTDFDRTAEVGLLFDWLSRAARPLGVKRRERPFIDTCDKTLQEDFVFGVLDVNSFFFVTDTAMCPPSGKEPASG